MRSHLFLPLVALLALPLGCPRPLLEPDTKPTSTVPPSPGPDPVLPDDVDPAEAACERFEELGCVARDGRELWTETPGGVSCPDVFRNAAKNDIDLHPACIAEMDECEGRHACTAKE